MSNVVSLFDTKKQDKIEEKFEDLLCSVEDYEEEYGETALSDAWVEVLELFKDQHQEAPHMYQNLHSNMAHVFIQDLEDMPDIEGPMLQIATSYKFIQAKNKGDTGIVSMHVLMDEEVELMPHTTILELHHERHDFLNATSKMVLDDREFSEIVIDYIEQQHGQTHDDILVPPDLGLLFAFHDVVTHQTQSSLRISDVEVDEENILHVKLFGAAKIYHISFDYPALRHDYDMFCDNINQCVQKSKMKP